MQKLNTYVIRFERLFVEDSSVRKLIWFSRFAIFFDYFYFGLLKVVGQSPAASLVAGLSEKTLPFIPSDSFLVILGIAECLIGLCFLFPRFTRYIVPIMLGHMLTTFMPLVLLPEATWSNVLIPTLGGQYIMKNIVLVALSLNIYATYLRNLHLKR